MRCFLALGCICTLLAACETTTPNTTSTFVPPASAVAATQATSRPTLAELIDPIVENALGQHGGVGAIVGVRRRADPPYIAAYGSADVQGTTPVDPCSAHPVASVTKQFTAAAVMQLVEQGKLDLDDPLSVFIGDAPPGWRNVTIRHLLNHTSGIIDPDDISLAFPNPYREQALEDVVAVIKELSSEPVFEPGSRHEYSNFGYLLLGAIIECASDMTYGQYLEANIFGPLGLDDTRFDVTLPSNLWPGYTRENGELERVGLVYPSLSHAAGGIVSTAADLLAWQMALAEGRVVSLDSYRQMITPTTLSSGSEYPYGFGLLLVALHCENEVRHDGGMPGYETVLLYCPDEDVGIVLMLNSNPSDPTAIHNLLAQLSRALLQSH